MLTVTCLVLLSLYIVSRRVLSDLLFSLWVSPPAHQLDLITDLLGTPPLSALASACEGARAHILRGPHKPVSADVELFFIYYFYPLKLVLLFKNVSILIISWPHPLTPPPPL